MRTRFSSVLVLSASLLLQQGAFGGIDSQALRAVEQLPSFVTDMFACGLWSDGAQRGHYRFVLAEVGGGAGTEVFIQRISETVDAGTRVLRVVSTTPVRELNNDHSQYLVSAAKCTNGNVSQLRATYEHDVGDVERLIRITPGINGSYRLSNVIRAANKKLGTAATRHSKGPIGLASGSEGGRMGGNDHNAGTTR